MRGIPRPRRPSSIAAGAAGLLSIFFKKLSTPAWQSIPMTTTKRLISVAALAALCLDTVALFAESPTPSPSPGAAASDLVQLTVKDEHGNEKQRASHGSRVDSSFLAPGQMVEIT